MKQNNIRKSVLLLLIFICNCFCTNAQTYYVKQNGTGDGSSWANASADLQATINAAATGTQVWVAAGTYYPNRRADAPSIITANDRNNAFVLKADVQLYGGFTGVETNLSDAKWNYNPTILSGDIGTVGDASDNCYHVVVGVGSMGTAVLKGFNIVNGNANTAVYPAPTLTINGASVPVSNGGGVYLHASGLPITNCIISFNNAINGGGLYSDEGSTNLTTPVQSCIFYYNVASIGGGAYFNGSQSLRIISNSIFANNSSSNIGYTGGAAFVNDNYSSFVNCTFFGNYSSEIYGTGTVLYTPGNGNLNVYNSICWGNPSGQLRLNDFSYFNGGTRISSSYSDLQNGLYTLTNNLISEDPQFTNSLNLIGPDGVWATADDGLIPSTSYKTTTENAGSNAVVPIGVTTDITGAPRIQDGIVDMGAYENSFVAKKLASSAGTNPTFSMRGATGILYGLPQSGWGSDGLICNINGESHGTPSGYLNLLVTVDPSVQGAASADKYVQRHYDIGPGTNSNGSAVKATITLYYLNSEFQAYNTAVGVGFLKLPDATISTTVNIQNLHISQFHGNPKASGGYDGTSFTPASVDLIPTSVVWNAFYKWWEVSVNINGLSGFFAKAGSGIILLPLKLLNFSGIHKDAYNQLQWQTAEETNTKKFVVEYSTDGISFNDAGMVDAKGSGNNLYNYKHNTNASLVFYKLKMIDIDGKFTYSDMIKLGSPNGTVVKLSSLFPNPTSNNITINIGDRALLQSIALLADQSGKTLEFITINGTSQMINLEKYSSGIYYLKLTNGQTLKIIKQ